MVRAAPRRPGAVYGAARAWPTEVNTYFLVTALLLCAVRPARRPGSWPGSIARRPWDALPFVLSPALLLTGLINWDLLAVAVRRRRAVGLVARQAGADRRDDRPGHGDQALPAVPARADPGRRLAPAPAAGPFGVAARRPRSRPGLLVNLPALADRLRAVEGVLDASTPTAAPTSGSLWLVLPHARAHRHARTRSTSGRWVLFGAVCVGVARARAARADDRRGWPSWRSWWWPAFLLVNKVYSPQYVLWLLPLAVLARPRWRDLLIWQAGELFYFAAVWLYLGGWLEAAAGGGAPAYDLAIWVRVAARALPGGGGGARHRAPRARPGGRGRADAGRPSGRVS